LFSGSSGLRRFAPRRVSAGRIQKGRLMTSYVDTLMHKRGSLTLTGLHWARAGYAEWVRSDGESEAAFLQRARHSARMLGFRILTYGGACRVNNDDEFQFINGGTSNARYTEDAEAGD